MFTLHALLESSAPRSLEVLRTDLAALFKSDRELTVGS